LVTSNQVYILKKATFFKYFFLSLSHFIDEGGKKSDEKLQLEKKCYRRGSEKTSQNIVGNEGFDLLLFEVTPKLNFITSFN